jgi:hypothetical protein
MKTKLLSLLLLTSVSIFNFSCTKDNDPADPTYQIAGLWIGTYTVTQLPQLQPLYYSFTIKPDGKVLAESVGADGMSYYSKGTWTLNGNLFTATYTSINYSGAQVTQSATLTYHNSGTLTQGTWTDVVNPNGGSFSGAFSAMARVN